MKRLAVLSVLATVSGCYLSVRAGPTVHRSKQLDFASVGWNLSAYIGVQHDFLGERMRIAINSGGGATAQQSSMGKMTLGQGGGGVELDYTLRNWVWWRPKNAGGCDTKDALGARWRTGIGFHANKGFDEAGDFADVGGMKTNIKTTGGYVFDADTEWGIWLGKFNIYGGAGIAWMHTDTADYGGVDAFSPYGQISIGYNIFFPRGLAVLMSHYPAVQADEEARKWRSANCSCGGAPNCTSSDESRCESARQRQVSGWEAEAERRRQEGAAFRASCNF